MIKIDKKYYPYIIGVVLLIVCVGWYVFSPNIDDNPGTRDGVITNIESVRNQQQSASDGIKDSQGTIKRIEEIRESNRQSNIVIEKSIDKISTGNKSSAELIGRGKQIICGVLEGKE